MFKQNNKIVSELWSREESTNKRYGRGFHWVESPIVKAYINENITGDKNLDWVTSFFNKYLIDTVNNTSCLSLGCGVGNLERHLCGLGTFKNMDAIDIASGALKQAIESANKLNYKIKYKRGDLNCINLKHNFYNVVFCNMSLHHVENLENLLEEINISLINEGLLVINEYVGPSQFQYSKTQIEVINNILNLLPNHLRKRVTDSSILKPSFIPPSVEYMNEIDPSEAIRSSEILSQINKRFKIIEHKDYGGTILHMLLQDIIGNFDDKKNSDFTILNLILYIEKVLIKEGVIQSDFAFVIAKKKNSIKNKVLASFYNNH